MRIAGEAEGTSRKAGGGEEDLLLGLGSNLGDRLEHLRLGVRLLRDPMEMTAVSSVVESEAEGVAADSDSPDFLNAVVRGRTRLAPAALLDACRRVERAAGRTRSRRGAPRTLDVDLLFYGSRTVRREGLTVPHPRWKERGFVLGPLREVAPEWRDPESGRTVEEICEERADLLTDLNVVAAASNLREDA